MTDRGAGSSAPAPAWVAEAVGHPIHAVRPARWGFRHETWIVEDAEGDRSVVQQRTDGSDPTLAPQPAIREAVRAAGLPVPEPVLVRSEAHSVVVMLPFFEGEVAADQFGGKGRPGIAGRACGTVATRLRAVRADGLRLPRGLASAVADTSLPPDAPATLREPLGRYLRRVIPVLETSPPAFAHGDLAPVNVLIRGGRVAAVLDLDRARMAHADYDAAWFAWVVTAHHPDDAGRAWHGYADASRMTGRSVRDVSWLWPLQLLERLREASDAGERRTWLERLAAALEATPGP